MDSEKDTAILLERARAYQEKEHKKNRARIKNGFRSMLIVPAVFLILMFLSNLTGTSKLIMLAVWIVSMLIISAYLIVVEYMDFKLMQMTEDDKEQRENELSARKEKE